MCCTNIFILYVDKWYSLFYILIFIFFVVKKIPKVVVCIFLMTTFAHFILITLLFDRDESATFETSFTATISDEYRINGPVIRGFMEDEEGRTIYFIYEFKLTH